MDNREPVFKENLTLTAKPENLRVLQKLITENVRIPDGLKKRLCLAAEEIFVNICSYAYDGGDGTVDFSMEISDKIVLTFCDSGKEFNPLAQETDVENYDLDLQIGGLGRFLAFDMVDDVEYEYREQKNVLVLMKYL